MTNFNSNFNGHNEDSNRKDEHMEEFAKQQESNKKQEVNDMQELLNKNNRISQQKRTRKSAIEYEQDLIELFKYLFMERFNIDNLMQEMSVSRRTVERMISHINEFYPCIKSTINDQDGRAYYSIKRDFSEEKLNNCFKKLNKRPLVYIFLMSFLVKPVSIQEVMKKLNIKQNSAIEIMNSIIDASGLVYLFDYNYTTYLSAWDFAEEKLIPRDEQ